MLNESLVYVVGKAVPSLLTFLTGMSLTWLLSPAEYGVYGLGLAISIVVSSTAFDWHALSFLRFYQSHSEDRRFMATTLQCFLLLCLGTAALGILVEFSGFVPREYNALILVCVPGCWCYSWFEFVSRVQVARFRPSSYLWMNLARAGLIFTFSLIVAWATRSPLLVLVASYLAMLLSGLTAKLGASTRRKDFNAQIMIRLVRFGWPIAFVHFLSAISIGLDRVLIEIFSGKEAVGFYTAAYALAQTSIATIGAGIDSATYSRAVRAMDSGDTAALQGQLARNCTLLLALMLPASVGLALIAPSLAALCVAPDYVAPVTELISWMAVAALLLGFRANYVDHAFHFGNSTSRLITVMAVIAIVNLGGDVVFIRLYGAVGAAMASIAAGVAGIICGLWMSRNILKLPFPMRDISRILAATGAMAACLWPFRDDMGVATLLCQIIGGVVVFGVAAVALDLLGVREALFSRIRAALG